MKFHVLVRPAARVDIVEAAKWYEHQQSGIGKEFSDAIEAAIDSLSETPLIHAIRYKRMNVRWLLASRFPYKIVYRVEKDWVVVYSVVHTARHDREWRKRIPLND